MLLAILGCIQAKCAHDPAEHISLASASLLARWFTHEERRAIGGDDVVVSLPKDNGVAKRFREGFGVLGKAVVEMAEA